MRKGGLARGADVRQQADFTNPIFSCSPGLEQPFKGFLFSDRRIGRTEALMLALCEHFAHPAIFPQPRPTLRPAAWPWPQPVGCRLPPAIARMLDFPCRSQGS